MSPLIGLLAQYHPEDGLIGTWSPGIGDPTFIGWFTVLGYFVAAALCLRALRALRGSGDRTGIAGMVVTLAPLARAFLVSGRRIRTLPRMVRLRALWCGYAVVLSFLGINKQLDLQTALTEIGRMAAVSGGWYENRREFQLVFIVVVLFAGAWIFRTVLQLAHDALREMAAALLGTVFLIIFVAIRASSFHHVDRLMGLHLGGVKINALLELGGIALVIVGAWRARAPADGHTRRGPPPRAREMPGNRNGQHRNDGG